VEPRPSRHYLEVVERHTRAVRDPRATARVLQENPMADSERSRDIREEAEKIAELRRYL